jgi:hypothetical protein
MLLATSGVPLHSIGLREIVPRTQQIYRPRVGWRPPYHLSVPNAADDVQVTYTRNVISVVDVVISAGKNALYQVYRLVKIIVAKPASARPSVESKQEDRSAMQFQCLLYQRQADCWTNMRCVGKG